MRKAIVLTEVGCSAPKEVFLEDYDAIPSSLKKRIEDNNGIPCEGTGNIWLWCEHCTFCESFDMEE